MQALDQADNRIREADLERHLEGNDEKETGPVDETVSPEEDYPLYEGLRLLRGANLLKPSPSQR